MYAVLKTLLVKAQALCSCTISRKTREVQDKWNTPIPTPIWIQDEKTHIWSKKEKIPKKLKIE